MGELKPSSWYDAAFREAPYTGGVEGNPFEQLWREMARRVPPGVSIVELGCGPGHLASLIAPDATYYIGVDWSREAVVAARRRLCLIPGAAIWREDLDAAGAALIPTAGFYIACEVLEHLQNDLALIGLIPKGRTILASLPKRDSESHVRHFPTSADVTERYSALIEFSEVVEFQDWWIVTGVRR